LVSAIISSGVGDPFGPGSTCTFGIRRNGIVAPRRRRRAALARLVADERRGFAVGLQPDQNAVAHDRKLRRLHAVVVVADRRHAAGHGAVGGDVEQLRSVFELADVGSFTKLVPA
jgi:hypothetical protein